MSKSRLIFLMLFVIVLAFVAGCNESGSENAAIISPKQSLPTLSQPRPQQYNKLSSQKPSAVESAIEISTKYAQLSEDMVGLKEKYQAAIAENQKLKDELSPCKSQLAQAQKELTEANDLLVEMRVELNNWKNNVIGFREEIRQADTAQLEALFKIMTILGGQPQQSKTESIGETTVAMND